MIASFLLDSLWQGALIVAIAACLTCFVPRRHAATRHALWFAALLALAVLPPVSQWHPAAPIGALPTSIVRTAAAASHATQSAASAGGNWLLALWAAGVLFCLVRLGLSYVRISRVVRDAAPARDLGPDVFLSSDVAIPVAVGIVAPAIVLPAYLPAALERGDLDAIVRHERAHVRRGDVVANLVQRVIEAVFFFNPWAYVIGRRLVAEREAACDDWAVDAMAEPDRYASCLARLAQSPQRLPALLTPSAIGSKSMLFARIARLMDGRTTRLKANYAVVTAGVVLFAVLGLALWAPRAAASAPADPSLPATCFAGVDIVRPAIPHVPKGDVRTPMAANVLVDVDANGKPVGAKIVKSSGNAAVDKAAVDAALGSTYTAALKNCKAVAGQYLFHLAAAP